MSAASTSIERLAHALSEVSIEYGCWDCNWQFWGQSETEGPLVHAARGHRVILKTTEKQLLELTDRERVALRRSAGRGPFISTRARGRK